MKIRAGSIQFIYETNARHFILVRLTPHGFGLRFNSRNSVEYSHGAVENAKRSLHFDGEVDVSRSVDEVQTLALPKTSRRGRGNRNSALALLRHPVHGCFTFVNFTDLVLAAGVKQNALGDRRLTCVDVRDNPEVSGIFDGIFSGHKVSGVVSSGVVSSGVAGIHCITTSLLHCCPTFLISRSERRRGWLRPCAGRPVSFLLRLRDFRRLPKIRRRVFQPLVFPFCFARQ